MQPYAVATVAERERGKRAGEHTLRRLIIAKDVYEMGSDVDGDCDVGSQKKKHTHTYINLLCKLLLLPV